MTSGVRPRQVMEDWLIDYRAKLAEAAGLAQGQGAPEAAQGARPPAARAGRSWATAGFRGLMVLRLRTAQHYCACMLSAHHFNRYGMCRRQGRARAAGLPGCSACDKASSASVNLSRARAAAEPAAEAAPAADVAAAAAEAAPAEAVPARAPALRRLWLTGSLGASPGAFGFFRTAHAEPLGDRLRLLLDYDLPSGIPPVDGTRVAVTGAPRPPPCPPPRPEIPPVHGYQAIMHCSVFHKAGALAKHDGSPWAFMFGCAGVHACIPSVLCGSRAMLRGRGSDRPFRALMRCRGGAQAWRSGWRAWRRWTWRRTCSRAACGARCGGWPNPTLCPFLSTQMRRTYSGRRVGHGSVDAPAGVDAPASVVDMLLQCPKASLLLLVVGAWARAPGLGTRASPGPPAS